MKPFSVARVTTHYFGVYINLLCVQYSAYVYMGHYTVPNRSVDASTIETVWSGNSLTISWEPLTLHEARGFPVYYIYLNDSSGPVKREIEPTANTIKSSIVIDELDSTKSYTVIITVATNNGTSMRYSSEPGLC